jgi:hypothetical protein
MPEEITLDPNTGMIVGKPPTLCSDQLRHGDESDTDCGGMSCDPCEVGRFCLADEDCSSSGIGRSPAFLPVPPRTPNGLFDGSFFLLR